MTVNDLDSNNEARAHMRSFLLWKRRWDTFAPVVTLQWEEYAYGEANVDSVPNRPGVYAFCIRPNIDANLNTSYLMYIGETRRTLRQRYREYLREEFDPIGRAHVYDFINMYRSHLTFCCAPLAAGVSPEQVEDGLLAAYMPPCNRRFPAEVRRVASVVYR